VRVVVAFCLLAFGCTSGPTSVLVRVTDGDAGPTPGLLTVDVFDVHGRIADATLPASSLPGSLIVRGLPDTAQVLRVVVRGAALLGGERVQTLPHAQASVDVALHSTRLDSDGDGVPDDLDDCPQVADPLQLDAAGSGPGDACLADGGASDLAAPDLMPPPSVCPAGVAFCDGFETATLASHWDTNNIQGATYSVDTARSYRGARSLKLHHDAVAPMAVAQAALGESQSFPTSDFFVRVFVYDPSPAVGVNEALLFAMQSATPYGQISLEIDDQLDVITFNNVASPTVYTASQTAFPLDRWVCLEWEVIATSSGSDRLWLDGNEVTALHVTQNLSATPPIDAMQFGISVYKPAAAVPAHDIWYDEVIVDGARVGCIK
jgi:hypothetical protein